MFHVTHLWLNNDEPQTWDIGLRAGTHSNSLIKKKGVYYFLHTKDLRIALIREGLNVEYIHKEAYAVNSLSIIPREDSSI